MIIPWRVTIPSHLTVDQTLHAIGRVTEHTSGVSPLNSPDDYNMPKLLFGTIDYTRNKFRLRKCGDLSAKGATIYQGHVDYRNNKCHIWVWARPTGFMTVVTCIVLFFVTKFLLGVFLNPSEAVESPKTTIWIGILYVLVFLFTYLEVRSTKKLFLQMLADYK